MGTNCKPVRRVRYKDPHVRALVSRWRDAYRGTQDGSPSDGAHALRSAHEIAAELTRIAPGWDRWGDDTRGGHAELVEEEG